MRAQSPAISAQLDRLAHSSNHRENQQRLHALLEKAGADPADKLAIQEAMIKEYQELLQWDSCILFCQQQVNEAQAAGNTFREAFFLKWIGNTFYHIPDKDKALFYWEKSLKISDQYGYARIQCQVRGNLAAYYLDNGEKLDKAENYLLEALRLTDTLKYKNDSYQSYRLLATLYEHTRQFKKSEEIYLRLIHDFRQADDSAKLAASMMFYAVVLGKMNNVNKAGQYVQESIAIAEKTKHLDLLQTGLQIYIDLLYQSGDIHKAWLIRNRLDEENRQRFKTDLNEKVSEADARFRTTESEHEKELAILKARKKNQFMLYGFIALFLIMSLLLYQFYQRRHIRQRLRIQAQVQEEKERLSRDLHDNLGSQLTLLSNNIAVLEKSFQGQKPVSGQIDKVKDTARALLQTLRETIWVLNRNEVTEEEFFDKLVDYAHRYVQPFGNMQLQVYEKFERQSVLQSGDALQLFRICQEAIHNTCKHSGSAELFIHGEADKDGFRLNLRDNGKGFRHDSADSEGHYGLTNMRERAVKAGVQLTIITAEGEGCQVELFRP